MDWRAGAGLRLARRPVLGLGERGAWRAASRVQAPSVFFRRGLRPLRQSLTPGGTFARILRMSVKALSDGRAGRQGHRVPQLPNQTRALRGMNPAARSGSASPPRRRVADRPALRCDLREGLQAVPSLRLAQITAQGSPSGRHPPWSGGRVQTSGPTGFSRLYFRSRRKTAVSAPNHEWTMPGQPPDSASEPAQGIPTRLPSSPARAPLQARQPHQAKRRLVHGGGPRQR